MEILSDEEIKQVCRDNQYVDFVCEIDRFIAKEAHKDTLRQVRELLDGIVSPYNPFDKLPPLTVFESIEKSNAKAFNEAIQTMKALLET